jgi:hypothetical protein
MNYLRRKNKVVIEITTSAAMTERDAVKALRLVLDTRLDLEKAPIWATDNSPHINKLAVKSFHRVTCRRMS